MKNVNKNSAVACLLILVFPMYLCADVKQNSTAKATTAISVGKDVTTTATQNPPSQKNPTISIPRTSPPIPPAPSPPKRPSIGGQSTQPNQGSATGNNDKSGQKNSRGNSSSSGPGSSEPKHTRTLLYQQNSGKYQVFCRTIPVFKRCSFGNDTKPTRGSKCYCAYLIENQSTKEQHIEEVFGLVSGYEKN